MIGYGVRTGGGGRPWRTGAIEIAQIEPFQIVLEFVFGDVVDFKKAGQTVPQSSCTKNERSLVFLSLGNDVHFNQTLLRLSAGSLIALT